MDHRTAGRYWEGNAQAWTVLARQGWDVYRDAVNTPAFLDLLPDVAGQNGLDVGCGEGHNTRLLAGRGAKMCGVDIAPTFIRFAEETERERSLGIQYAVASALELPFASGRFDFVAASMSLMDVPDHELALREAHRILRPGGFLQFSISILVLQLRTAASCGICRVRPTRSRSAGISTASTEKSTAGCFPRLRLAPKRAGSRLKCRASTGR